MYTCTHCAGHMIAAHATTHATTHTTTHATTHTRHDCGTCNRPVYLKKG